MDLPPLQFEMVRLGLQGEPAQQLCRPAPEREESLGTSFSGSPPCRDEASRLRIDMPPGWPVTPPPPPPQPSRAARPARQPR